MARTLALPAPPPVAGLRHLATEAARVPAIAVAIAGAWLLLAGAELTGTSDLLHHHALIEHGPAPWIALPAFLLVWLVMIVAMMLPASVPAIGAHLAAVAVRARAGITAPSRPLARFLAPYVAAWTAFGVAVFLGDTIVHRVVHALPWLEARTFLIDAAVLGCAGVYQLLPIKRRSLDACRHPGVASSGRDHALACLATSGALMLLMFSEGFSSPAWMIGLTGVMAYEATGRHGQLVGTSVGVLLLAGAVGVVLTGQAL